MPMTQEQRELEADIRERRRRPGESNLEHQVRIIQLDQDKRAANGSDNSEFLEQHGAYDLGFVLHAETGTLHHTKRNRLVSSLVRMHANGSLDNDQFVASQMIIAVYEALKRDADVQCCSMEARVDNGRGRKSAEVERLKMVRAEIAYTMWGARLKADRQLILEMLTEACPMRDTAKRFKVSWRTARQKLKDALDEYALIHKEVSSDIKKADIERAHERLAD